MFNSHCYSVPNVSRLLGRITLNDSLFKMFFLCVAPPPSFAIFLALRYLGGVGGRRTPRPDIRQETGHRKGRISCQKKRCVLICLCVGAPYLGAFPAFPLASVPDSRNGRMPCQKCCGLIIMLGVVCRITLLKNIPSIHPG